MYRDGCRDAVRVGGGGDLGADVKATDPFGRRWSVNCTSVGSLSGTTTNPPRRPIVQGPATRSDRGTSRRAPYRFGGPAASQVPAVRRGRCCRRPGRPSRVVSQGSSPR
ncbi:hypothetical protein ACFVIY_28400 [Streptomyces sp. NPDC127166]|uniref:hypothetical protein n=1 Tax=Streptomyces sp. NPDC127166 TaxID=3345380 RepID=UPI00363F43C7